MIQRVTVPLGEDERVGKFYPFQAKYSLKNGKYESDLKSESSQRENIIFVKGQISRVSRHRFFLRI
jgi:hypothetical protein